MSAVHASAGHSPPLSLLPPLPAPPPPPPRPPSTCLAFQAYFISFASASRRRVNRVGTATSAQFPFRRDLILGLQPRICCQPTRNPYGLRICKVSRGHFANLQSVPGTLCRQVQKKVIFGVTWNLWFVTNRKLFYIRLGYYTLDYIYQLD